MKPTFAFVLFFLLYSMTAAAQDKESSSIFELRGSGGWIAFGDESLIHHALAGASLRITLISGLGVEPEITYMVGPKDDRDIVFAPVVSWEFGKRRVRPYVLGAFGVLWHRERDFWGSEWIASGGFGVRTQLSPRWSISPEFRAGMWPHVEGKVALGYRF